MEAHLSDDLGRVDTFDIFVQPEPFRDPAFLWVGDGNRPFVDWGGALLGEFSG